MNYQLTTTKLDLFPTLRKCASSETPHEIYIGLDAELTCCAVSVIVDGGTPSYLGKFSRDDIADAVAELLSLHHHVALAQEACKEDTGLFPRRKSTEP